MKGRVLTQTCLILVLISLSLADISSGKQPDEKISPAPLSKEDIFNELELFADAITLINANYAEEVKPKNMIYGALNGMLSSLDPHSSFLTPEELKEIQTETMGEFGGIGIKVTVRDKMLTVISPLEDTPAYKVGIKPGDKILEIDDESTKDFTLDDVVSKLRGIPGTEVKLTILREDEDKIIDFMVKRTMIKLKSVKPPLLLGDNIGYIRIVEFQQYTTMDLDKAIKELVKQNMKGLILDLRSNPGGLLTSAVSVSEKFLKKGEPIVLTKGRIESQNMEFKSKAFRPYTDFPIAVLINRGSASASEIVAGALRDDKRAVIVGETSFGKGSVQTVIPMRDKSALRLTTSYYYTPSGKIIHEKGVIPDLEVKLAKIEDDEEIEEDSGDEKKNEAKSDSRPEKEILLERLNKDAQVQAAITLLKDEPKYKEILKG